MTKAENVGADIGDFFGREDQVRHLRVRSRKEDPESRRRHTLGVCNFLKVRADGDYRRRCICGVDNMAGDAGFASESTPRGGIALLSIRIPGCCGQSGREHRRS